MRVKQLRTWTAFLFVLIVLCAAMPTCGDQPVVLNRPIYRAQTNAQARQCQCLPTLRALQDYIQALEKKTGEALWGLDGRLKAQQQDWHELRTWQSAAEQNVRARHEAVTELRTAFDADHALLEQAFGLARDAHVLAQSTAEIQKKSVVDLTGATAQPAEVPEASLRSAAADAVKNVLKSALPSAAAGAVKEVFGLPPWLVGVSAMTGPAGLALAGLWIVGRWLLTRRRRKRAAASPPAASAAGGPSTLHQDLLQVLQRIETRRGGQPTAAEAEKKSERPEIPPRNTTELHQLVQLRQLEGRDPLLDAAFGMFVEDELRKLLDAGDIDEAETTLLRDVLRRVRERVDQAAPLSVRGDA